MTGKYNAGEIVDMMILYEKSNDDWPFKNIEELVEWYEEQKEDF